MPVECTVFINELISLLLFPNL